MRTSAENVCFSPKRERSQGTARWMRSIRAALDGVTRIILFVPEQQTLFPRPPGEGRGLGQSPKNNKSTT